MDWATMKAGLCLIRNGATQVRSMTDTLTFRSNSGSPSPRYLEGNLNSRNWRMPLCSFAVGRIVTEDKEYHSYGGFVIDTSLNRQDEILNLLSDGDMRRIAVALGIIPHHECAMPPNMKYDLSGFAVSPMDLTPTPTFRSESGHKIWIS